ncbi:MAG: cob(I)yrinic acid a,c-diamide adenosyltransferase [Clostridiales Family XIII bacterium]|jgi:cob(I)alamin adenosyltransferase|nr:cob(I)yrinic acid a,c-diamide adenosyltransferase [Clostridiales Family XIII bacterium]
MGMKGYTQVYTGDGKGKTTAAMGLALRAVGAGKRVLLVQFMKAQGCSEHNILKDFSDLLTWRTAGKPFFLAEEGAVSGDELEAMKGKCIVFPPGNPPADYVAIIREAFDEVREAAISGRYDVVILDEINCILHFGLLPLDEVLHLIDAKDEGVELVLTGRGAPGALIEKADLVTEMKEIKHYFAKGVIARRGIEN